MPGAARTTLCVLIVSALVLTAPASLRSQAFLLQPGSGAGLQGEKFPSPRDPSYVAPVLPQGVREDAGDSLEDPALLLATGGLEGGGGDLLSVFTERRRRQQEAARRNDRYGEQRALDLEEAGQERVLAEQSVLNQFGDRGFPRGLGSPPQYTETPARRFGIIWGLSMPITTGFAAALYELAGPGIRTNGAPDYAALGGVFAGGALLAAFIAYYDYDEMQQLYAHRQAHAAHRRYLMSRDGPRGAKGALGGDNNVSYLERAERPHASLDASVILKQYSAANFPTVDVNRGRDEHRAALGWSFRF